MTTFRNRRPRRLHGRRGTAIVEFAVSLPLLALVLTVTFFFGWAVMNQNHVWIADRYACWRQVRNGSVPTDGFLNQKFFGGVAQNVATGRNAGSTRTEQDLVSAVSAENQPAGSLAQELVLNQFPKGLDVTIQATFPTSVRFWQQFTGAIHSQHARAGVEWRWRQAACGNAVADQLLQTLDGMLTAMPVPANGIGSFFSRLYRDDWRYYNGLPWWSFGKTN
jgi:hypothetical protein